MSRFLEYLAVIALSSFKVIPGALLGIGYGFSFLEHALCTFTGGMLGLWFWGAFGTEVRLWWRRFRKLPDDLPIAPPVGFVQKTWERAGYLGLAFLIPVFITPPLGALLAVSLRISLRKIVLQGAVGMGFWSLVFAYSNNFLKEGWDSLRLLFA